VWLAVCVTATRFHDEETMGAGDPWVGTHGLCQRYALYEKAAQMTAAG